MIYSNIVESQIIGNAVMDLRREEVVDKGQGDPVRYEPAHSHFLTLIVSPFSCIQLLVN